MGQCRFAEGQIVEAVEQVESWVSIPEMCGKDGACHETLYRWRKNYGTLSRGERARLLDKLCHTAMVRKLQPYARPCLSTVVTLLVLVEGTLRSSTASV